MKRVWGHVLAGATLVCGTAAVFAACVHDNASIFIRSVQQPKFAQTGMICEYTADPAQPVMSQGRLDIAVQAGYIAEFLVGNQMVPQSNPQQLRSETATVTLQGAIVRITDAAGNQLKTFTRLAAATLDPASGSLPGYALEQVLIVDPDTAKAAALAANLGPIGLSGVTRVVTYTRFFGNTLGGQYIESDEFAFPVDICIGCLINFTNAMTDCNGNVLRTPNCVVNTGAGQSTNTQPQIPCIPGQDLNYDCTACTLKTCQGYYFMNAMPDSGACPG